jgi:hypothetical protein
VHNTNWTLTARSFKLASSTIEVQRKTEKLFWYVQYFHHQIVNKEAYTDYFFKRSLLENKNDEQDDVDPEDDGVDDEELNLILKRSDDEYTTFVEIDKQREKQEQEWWQAMGGTGKKPERLLQEHELPDVYRVEETADTIMEELEFGRGQRSKEQVRYDDGLTERQWVKV